MFLQPTNQYSPWALSSCSHPCSPVFLTFFSFLLALIRSDLFLFVCFGSADWPPEQAVLHVHAQGRVQLPEDVPGELSSRQLLPPLPHLFPYHLQRTNEPTNQSNNITHYPSFHSVDAFVFPLLLLCVLPLRFVVLSPVHLLCAKTHRVSRRC